MACKSLQDYGGYDKTTNTIDTLTLSGEGCYTGNNNPICIKTIQLSVLANQIALLKDVVATSGCEVYIEFDYHGPDQPLKNVFDRPRLQFMTSSLPKVSLQGYAPPTFATIELIKSDILLTTEIYNSVLIDIDPSNPYGSTFTAPITVRGDFYSGSSAGGPKSVNLGLIVSENFYAINTKFVPPQSGQQNAALLDFGSTAAAEIRSCTFETKGVNYLLSVYDGGDVTLDDLRLDDYSRASDISVVQWYLADTLSRNYLCFSFNDKASYTWESYVETIIDSSNIQGFLNETVAYSGATNPPFFVFDPRSQSNMLGGGTVSVYDDSLEALNSCDHQEATLKQYGLTSSCTSTFAQGGAIPDISCPSLPPPVQLTRNAAAAPAMLVGRSDAVMSTSTFPAWAVALLGVIAFFAIGTVGIVASAVSLKQKKKGQNYP